jgi:hypothetical protein
MLTYGELPCPTCGYQRKGTSHASVCPECGARGFAGDIVLSGLPSMSEESRLGQRALSLSHLILGLGMLFCFVATYFAGAVGLGAFAFQQNFARVRFGIMLLVFALLIVALLRRRKAKHDGLSLERCVWEFDQDGVIVREKTHEARVPTSEITEVHSSIDFVKRRTHLTLVTSGQSLGVVGLPSLIIGGTLDEQRAIAAAIKAYVKR